MAPLTRKRKSEQDFLSTVKVDDSIMADVDESNIIETKQPKKLPVRAKDGEAPTDTHHPVQGTMKVFTDEDYGAKTKEPRRVTKKPAAPISVEEEESDDDEAPEAVSTQQVASSFKKSAQAAQKAAKQQAAAEKRKRQERDALFKQQAEERKKLEEENNAVLAASAARDEAADLAHTEATSRRRRAGKVEIPDVLPAEFLTDSSSEEEDEDEEMGMDIHPKKRKISTVERKLSRQDRGPRDERVGSTVYRVAKQTDDRMAPKAKKHAKSSKDLLLKRNRAAMNSRPGFFAKK